MNEIDKRKAFQRVKSMSNEQFWDWMNWMHSRAYAAAVKHYTESAEMVLPPRLQKQLHDKATEIRESWDGMKTVSMDKTEHMEFEKVMRHQGE